MSKKIMPSAKIANPSSSLAIYQDLTSALGRIWTKPWEGSTSSDAPKVAQSIEEALEALMGQLNPERILLKQALQSGSSRVLRDLLETHGAQVYLDLHAQAPVSFSEPVKRANIAQLRVLLEYGFDLSDEASRMLRQIRRHQDAAFLSFLRDEMKSTARFSDDLTNADLLGNPPDLLIPEIAQECRDTLGTSSSDSSTNGLIVLGKKMHLKYLALLLMTGRPVEQILQRNHPTEASDPVAKLVKMSTSAHGRLELHRLEPSLEDVLKRPLDSEFFGIAADEASFMMHQWPLGSIETNEDIQ